jgi:hypothetical protein
MSVIAGANLQGDVLPVPIESPLTVGGVDFTCPLWDPSVDGHDQNGFKVLQRTTMVAQTVVTSTTGRRGFLLAAPASFTPAPGMKIKEVNVNVSLGSIEDPPHHQPLHRDSDKRQRLAEQDCTTHAS